MREPQHNNAKITGTMLGIEDHGHFTNMIYLEWPGGGVGFGGWATDEWDEKTQKRVDKNGLTGEYIKALLDVVGVEKWEQLQGKHVVVETGGVGTTCTGIRNLLDETKWFRPKEWFEERGYN